MKQMEKQKKDQNQRQKQSQPAHASETWYGFLYFGFGGICTCTPLKGYKYRSPPNRYKKNGVVPPGCVPEYNRKVQLVISEKASGQVLEECHALSSRRVPSKERS